MEIGKETKNQIQLRMMENYFSLIIIVGIISAFQFIAFAVTERTRRTLRSIFPEKINETIGLYEQEDGIKFIGIKKKIQKNKVFNEILETINRYLSNNKGSADYAILKDITDRNSDAVEAQIETASPIPVYIGLCGTLIGIVMGVISLAFGGGIDALFDTKKVETVESISEVPSEFKKDGTKIRTKDSGKEYVYLGDSDKWEQYEDKGAEGIKKLLQGVAIAMTTTLFGVFLTIIGSVVSKYSSKINEKRKNSFLSWLQAELLPKMSNDLGQVIFQMQRNLDRFNNTFSRNTSQLDIVLKGINTSYENQTRLLNAVDKLKVDEIATANIRVLEELKECTEQINELKQFIARTTDYINRVESLNGQLADHLDRTKLIENMGQFFKDEVTQIEQRKNAITKSVADVDLNMQMALDELIEHTGREYQKLDETLANKHANFLKAIDDQQEALNRKLEETSLLIEELKNLTAVKESIEQLALAEQNQNAKIETLVTTSTEQNSRIAALVDCVNKIAASVSSQNAKLEKLQSAVEKSSDKKENVAPVKSPVTKPKTPVWKTIVEILICLSALGLLGLNVFNMFFK